ncbi:MAG: hypothetical protein WDO74_32625 [Pseudomonadota bacterium]
MRRFPVLLGSLLTAAVAARASAFVTMPVGGHAGELDVEARVTAERGTSEPNENTASIVKARGFYEAKLGVGYTFGTVGPLQLLSFRLEGTWFRSPEEKNDPSRWIVGSPGSGSAAPGAGECRAGARYLGNGVCQFYPADRGALLSGSASFAAIHEAGFALSFFVRGTVPIDMDLKKFEASRLDYFAGGSTVGLELRAWLGYESSIFFGSGTFPFGKQQNPVVAVTNLFHVHAERWIFPWRAGIKFGPYVEGDLRQRFDERYDAAYSPVSLPQPGAVAAQQNDRVRQIRFATALLPYFLVTPRLAVEAGYIQKFFGYDARATYAVYLGLRGLFELR